MSQSPLDGAFVHIFDENQNNTPKHQSLIRQGQVIGTMDDLIVVKIFSFVDGRPTRIECYHKNLLLEKKMIFYVSEDEMVLQFEKMQQQSQTGEKDDGLNLDCGPYR
jgi:hypothetical protein